MATLDSCFLWIAVCGHVPGALGPLLGGVSTLGPVTDDTAPAWLSRDKMLFASRQARLGEKLRG